MISQSLEKMNQFLADMDKKARDYYIHYAYCPKCAEKYGHNHMIIFALIWLFVFYTKDLKLD